MPRRMGPTRFRAAVFTGLLTAVINVQASDNGLARTPQMGWDNWNAFKCHVSDELMVQTGNLIVNYGLKDLGYHYVILDDCWSAGRDATKNNTLIADPVKFPRGMKAVADDIHSLGLGWGMYSSAGTKTCAGYEGSLGKEEIDAQTFADWGADYLKYDNCYNEGQAGTQALSRNRYEVMSKALNATGRLMHYSICNWGEDFPWNWALTISNSWRMSGDVFDFWNVGDARCPCDGSSGWNCELPGFHCSIMNIANKVAPIVDKGRPGGWNDMDMLEVGNGGMTDAEYVAHFSLWSAAKSPLIMGNDLRKLSAPDLAILSNPAVIAINQDTMGQPVVRRSISYFSNLGAISNYIFSSAQPLIQIWSGPLTTTTSSSAGLDMVVLFINGLTTTSTLNATLDTIFMDQGPGGTAPQIQYQWELRDVWSGFNRLSDADAASIISGTNAGTFTATGSKNSSVVLNRFNLTSAGTYGAAVAQANTSSVPGVMEMLLGEVVGTVAPEGTISVSVEAHGCKMFRMRAMGEAVIKKRDEL